MEDLQKHRCMEHQGMSTIRVERLLIRATTDIESLKSIKIAQEQKIIQIFLNKQFTDSKILSIMFTSDRDHHLKFISRDLLPRTTQFKFKTGRCFTILFTQFMRWFTNQSILQSCRVLRVYTTIDFAIYRLYLLIIVNDEIGVLQSIHSRTLIMNDNVKLE